MVSCRPACQMVGGVPQYTAYMEAPELQNTGDCSHCPDLKEQCKGCKQLKAWHRPISASRKYRF
eukprot:1156152-Pelagomonas_calceolata.AAC.2